MLQVSIWGVTEKTLGTASTQIQVVFSLRYDDNHHLYMMIAIILRKLILIITLILNLADSTLLLRLWDCVRRFVSFFSILSFLRMMIIILYTPVYQMMIIIIPK